MFKDIIFAVLTILFVFVVPAWISISVSNWLVKANPNSCYTPYQQQNPPFIPTAQEVKPFSLSKYLDRIESEHIKILQDKEEKKPYTIILWLNLDGLRLNEDGSFEWIQRVKNKEPEKVSITSKNDLLPMMTRNIFQAQNHYWGTGMCQSLQADREQLLGYSQCCQTVQSQIRDCMCSQTQQIDSCFRNLESQISKGFRQLQMEQNLAMIYALHPPMPPTYSLEGLNYGQTTQHF